MLPCLSLAPHQGGWPASACAPLGIFLSVPGEGIQFLPQPRGVYTCPHCCPATSLPCSTCCWKAAWALQGLFQSLGRGREERGRGRRQGEGERERAVHAGGRKEYGEGSRVQNVLGSRVPGLSCKETWVPIPMRPSHHPSPKGHLRVLEWGHLCTFHVSISQPGLSY